MDKYASLYLIYILAPTDFVLSLNDSNAITVQWLRMDLTMKALCEF